MHTSRKRTLVISLLVYLAQFVIILNSMVVIVGLPSIRSDLTFSRHLLMWVVNTYALTFGGFLILGGGCADFFGRKRAFVFGISTFSISSIACGLANSQSFLLVSRALQGMGAALIAPSVLSIIIGIFPVEPARRRALAAWGAVNASAASVALLIGGVLTAYASWRFVFFLNAVVGLLIVVAVTRYMPTFPASKAGKLDLGGAVAATAGAITLVYTISSGGHNGWTSVLTLASGVTSIACTVVFILLQRARSHPLVDLRLFRSRELLTANIVMLPVAGISISFMYFGSIFLQEILDYSALTTGFAFLPLTVALVIGSSFAPKVLSYIGLRSTLLAALTLIAIVAFLLSHISSIGSYTYILLLVTLMYIGVGCAIVTLIIMATSTVDVAGEGMASGLINTGLLVGSSLGIVLLSSATVNVESSLSIKEGLLIMAAAFQGIAFAAMTAVGIILVLLRRRHFNGFEVIHRE